MTKDKKAYMKAYRLAHRERIAKLKKDYRLAHLAEYKARDKAYYELNREKEIARSEAYRLAHKEQCRICAIKRYWEHREKELIRQRTYIKSKRGKEVRRKIQAKRRRNLGFIPLNESFEGAHAHHIDREKVIYIPEELHNSIWHSVTKNINMEEINNVALGYCH